MPGFCYRRECLIKSGGFRSMPAGGTPENITVTFLSPTEVRVSWTAEAENVEKYDVTYKPMEASYRVVQFMARNSDSVVLSGLKPNTQYQVTVTAVRGGRKYRSRPVIFRTMAAKPPPEPPTPITGSPPDKITRTPVVPPYPNMTAHPVTQVRGVEVGIVCLVLLVWVGAIALFFNRWGKIRMLLPYQPDYKDTQLKVPGSCQQNSTCQATGSAGFCCSQRQLSRVPDDWLNGSRRLLGGRSRTNSAVYIEPTRSELTEPLFERGCQGNKSKSADHLPNAELNLPTINLKCFRDDPLLMNEETTSSLPQSQPPITLSPPPAPL
ncbi:uncharacterized protein isoform X3 [Rhodnius prolixus]|uniref:uncharacterized protein isoform X3 n=1 Tax=Rhodnius prolixus TaxID=13249 RepID=UPI003D18F1F6